MMRTGVVLAVVIALAAPAAADEPVETERYGALIVLGDAMALTMTVAGDRAEHDVIRGVGFTASLSGAPLIHLAEGNTRGAVKSLALRLTLPIATAYLGKWMFPGRLCFEAVDEEESQSLCGSGNAHTDRIQDHHVMGFVVGLAAASVIDATVFAKKSVRRSGREWQPDVTFRDGGARATVRFSW